MCPPPSHGGFIRVFIDAILAFIVAESLTDEEFATFTISSQTYTEALYLEILAVLDSRELVSSTRNRLTLYFEARGVEVEETSSGVSNITVGGGFE